MDSILSLLGSSYDTSAYASLYSSLYGTNSTGSVYEDLLDSIYGTEESSSSNLDTEALVESSVSGIRQKIERLEQERTKTEWEQDAYQNIIDMMSDFSGKYLSGSSSTNLLSDSFWNGALSIGTTGGNADKISANGDITTDVQILGIKQLAQSASYSVSGTVLGVEDSENGISDLDTSKTLGELLDENVWDSLTPSGIDEDGNATYDFVVNGEVVGTFTKGTALESVLTTINNNDDADVSVSYSQTTNQFLFRAGETGSASYVELGDGLAAALFGGGTTKAGQDAVFSMSINGQELIDMTQSSNSIHVDGLTVNLKGTFNYNDAGELDSSGDAIGFTISSDADKIVDAVKAMVEDYNALVAEVKAAYSTQPAYGDDGSSYEPLTDAERANMSADEIAAYEEKAKEGILFADNDVRSLYENLRDAISSNSLALSSIGLTTEYSDGLTTLSLDEDALRSALESDPESVQEAFTASADSGAAADGFMQSLKDTLDTYGSTSGEKGILVNLAGSAVSSSSTNQSVLQNELDEYNEQIAALENTLASQIDYYTSQYTMLDLYITQMNSQSMTLLDMLSF